MKSTIGAWSAGVTLTALFACLIGAPAFANEGGAKKEEAKKEEHGGKKEEHGGKEEAAKKPPVETVKSGRPIPPPDPKSRIVPELVCTATRSLTINNDTLATNTSETPRRMRLRGNMVYWGGMSGDETFWGTINRTDRRRWVANTAVLVLSDDLLRGSWFDLQANSTLVRHLTCTAVETPKR